MFDEGMVLLGGRTTSGVVRVGQTVRRPMNPHSDFVHRLLGHLKAKGFAGAPRFLGVDSYGREILSYLPGDVPSELGEFTRSQRVSAARLLRELHDATTPTASCAKAVKSSVTATRVRATASLLLGNQLASSILMRLIRAVAATTWATPHGCGSMLGIRS